MKALVLYNSVFGNTEQIAKAIASALGEGTEIRKVNQADLSGLTGIDLLVVGSPTRGFNPTDATKNFIKSIPSGALKGIQVTAFDTRIDIEEVKSGFLTFMVNIFGYAAKPIANTLKGKGGQPVGTPAGFFVLDREGPLREGELERAAAWAKGIAGD